METWSGLVAQSIETADNRLVGDVLVLAVSALALRGSTSAGLLSGMARAVELVEICERRRLCNVEKMT